MPTGRWSQRGAVALEVAIGSTVLVVALGAIGTVTMNILHHDRLHRAAQAAATAVSLVGERPESHAEAERIVCEAVNLNLGRAPGTACKSLNIEVRAFASPSDLKKGAYKAGFGDDGDLVVVAIGEGAKDVVDSSPRGGDTEPEMGDTEPGGGDTEPGMGDIESGGGDIESGMGGIESGGGDIGSIGGTDDSRSTDTPEPDVEPDGDASGSLVWPPDGAAVGMARNQRLG